MRKNTSRVSVYRLVSTLALTCSVSAHSWIEYAQRIAPNGTMVGERGFPRGYIPRSQPGFNDTIPQQLLPVIGQSAYSGEEILNKFPFEANPKTPLLQASPGEHIAIIHLENGHVSQPQNQRNKPHNRGTIFFYGTAQPKESEKLFDVHLRWNKDGTGGDKRGILLGTRNYDDGQCFQPNGDDISKERASKFSSAGAKISQELPCQSDIKLPDGLKPGSVYTVYWYWDWPDLNPDKINMDKTKDGSYPWAGSFMRGDAVPNGWTKDMISKNESYASVIDIKIVEGQPQSFVAKFGPKEKWIAQQNIYSKAIEEQMSDNFQVKVDDIGGGGGGASGSAPVTPTSTSTGNSTSFPSASDKPPAATSLAGSGVVTVTQTVTVPPTTILKTVYRSVDPGETASTQPAGHEANDTLPNQPEQTNGTDSQTSLTPCTHTQSPTTDIGTAPPASSTGGPGTVTRFRRRAIKRSVRFD